MRTFFSSLAVVVLTALIMPQSSEGAHHYRHSAAPKVDGAVAHSRLRSDSYWSPQQDDVVQDGWVIGRDPDPSIRSQILRDSVGGGPG